MPAIIVTDMICLVMFEKLINKFTDRIISKIKLVYAINLFRNWIEISKPKGGLAHHQNDVIENIVMQLQRHNTKGYLGIQEISEVFGVTVIDQT